MTAINWLHSNSGTWTDARDWSGDAVPGPAEAVVIAAGHNSGTDYIITIDSAVRVHGLTLDASGATLNMASGSLSLGTLTLDAGTISGGTIAVSGGVVAAGGVLDGVTSDGVLDLGDISGGPSSLDIENGITLHGSNGMGTGTILLTGDFLSFIGQGSQTLGSATLDLDNKGSVLTGTDLTLASSLAIERASNMDFEGARIVNDTSIIGSSATGRIAVFAQDFTNEGVFALSGGEEASFTGQLGDVFDNYGQLTIGEHSRFQIEGIRGTHPPVLNNYGTITLQDGILVMPIFYESYLTNEASGDITGSGRIGGAFTNFGLIEAAGGTLTLLNGVGGPGIAQADAGATLVVTAGAAFGTVGFAGAGGTIALDFANFRDEVAGFAPGDMIDIKDMDASAASFSGTSIVVTRSTGGTAVLHTTTALTGSLSVTAETGGYTLLTYANSQDVPTAHPAAWATIHPGSSRITMSGVSPVIKLLAQAQPTTALRLIHNIIGRLVAARKRTVGWGALPHPTPPVSQRQHQN